MRATGEPLSFASSPFLSASRRRYPSASLPTCESTFVFCSMRASRAEIPEPIACDTSQIANTATASAATVTMSRSRCESLPTQASASARSFFQVSISASPRTRRAPPRGR